MKKKQPSEREAGSAREGSIHDYPARKFPGAARREPNSGASLACRLRGDRPRLGAAISA